MEIRVVVGGCGLGTRNPLSLSSYDSRSVLAVKGSLRRAKRAPLTAPGRSEVHNLYEGKGIKATSRLSIISASAPRSAFHQSTVLKRGHLPARSYARRYPLETRKTQKSRVTKTGLIVSRPASIGRVLRYRARFERKVYHNSQLQPCLRP